MSAKFSSNSSLKRLANYMKSRTFLFALLLGVLAHLGGFLVFKVLSRAMPAPMVYQPFVEYVSPKLLDADPALKEQASLFDAAPLFIPTSWNASREQVELGFDSVIDGFGDYLPEFRLLAELKPDGINEELVSDVRAPVDLLQPRFINLFSEVGTTGASSPVSFEASGPRAIFQRIGSGEYPDRSQKLIEIALDGEVPISGGIELLQNPARFYISMSGDGRLVSGPSLLTSSGVAAFDSLIIQWLKTPGVFSRLPGGDFEVEVYP